MTRRELLELIAQVRQGLVPGSAAADALDKVQAEVIARQESSSAIR